MVIFSTRAMGVEVLSLEDKGLLKSKGIKIDNLIEQYPPYKREYLWGRLSQLLGEYNSKKVEYKDFLKFLEKRQYRPLTKWEKASYEAASKRSYSHIKRLGERIKTSVVSNIAGRQDFISKEEHEKIISDVVKRAVYDRGTIQSVVSEIGHKTNDWERDLGRIAETEMNNVFQLGRMHEIIEEHGEDSLVYKDVFDGACKHCIRLYLTRGLGSRPIIFKLSDLIANGSNIGRKVNEWLATVEGVHPYCRCRINYLDKLMVWDNELKEFSYPKKYVSKSDLKIKVNVGDKVFSV